MDAERIRATGPWVLLKVEQADLSEGYEKTAGGLYKPQGNMEERMGQVVGLVISTGPGEWLEKAGKYRPTGVEKGQRILFRGFLSEANKPEKFDLSQRDYCFIHMKDLLGVVE